MQVNAEGFVVAKSQRKRATRADAMERSLKPVSFYNDMELMAVPTGSIFVFDAEVYRNFFYVAFKNVVTGKVIAFERSPDGDFDSNKLRWMLWRFLIVGFNSNDYDIPILTVALAGFSNSAIKDCSDWLISNGRDEYGKRRKIQKWQFEKQFKVRIPEYNHVDLIEVAPLDGSLKLYAGRLHCDRMQDLPFDPAHILTATEAAIVRPYCCNDLDNTQLLAWELWPAIELRTEMSKTYGTELRSKSDAQVAEAVFNAEIQKITGVYPKKVDEVSDEPLQYNIPDIIKFKSPELNAMLDKIRNARFELDGLGSPMWPHGLGEKEKSETGKEVWVLKVKIGNNEYKLGMGGLHSAEKKVTHLASEDIVLEDDDVESFYPRIILNQRLYPHHIGPVFIEVYEKLVTLRLHAKAQYKIFKDAGDKKAAKHWKQIADSLKITINGSFGKLGSRWSTIYAPQLMLQVTISGQLFLCMLIEMLEEAGIPCISANTDGVISKFHKSQNATKRAVIAEWERITNFKTEATRYLGVYSRDVNAYMALKAKFDKKTNEWTNQVDMDPEARFLDQQLGFKIKGAFCERGSAGDSILAKNPETLVCVDAVLKYLALGQPINRTIRECKDFRRFTAVKNVKGGGEKNGFYLGKVVRWYYPKNEPGYIAYVGSGNKVGKTDGARPAMDLPETFPEDIDYNYYIKAAGKILYDIGVMKKAETAQLF